MASIFDIFDESRERLTQKCFTPNFPNRIDSRWHEMLRSKSDSCTPFAKPNLSEGRSRSRFNEESFSSVKTTSKSPITTPRTPLQTLQILQLNSQQCSRKTAKEELKKPRVSIKPCKLFAEESGSLFHDENGEGARTPSNEECLSANMKILKSPLSTPRVPFQRLMSNSQQLSGRSLKEGFKRPCKSFKPFKIFEDPTSKSISQDNVNDGFPSIFYPRNTLEVLPNNVKREKYVNGIRRRKYIILAKESKKILQNTDQQGPTTPKELKRNCKLMKEFKIFDDPESQSVFCDENYISSFKLETKNNRDHLPRKENYFKNILGIRRRKYIHLGKRLKTLNSQQQGQQISKHKLKRNCKLMESFEIFEDLESGSIFPDNVNENIVDAMTNELPPTKTIGVSFWVEENYTPQWDNMLTAEDINAISTTLDVCSTSDGVSDLCVSPEMPCMLIDNAGLDLGPSTPAFTLVVDSPKDIPVPWES